MVSGICDRMQESEETKQVVKCCEIPFRCYCCNIFVVVNTLVILIIMCNVFLLFSVCILMKVNYMKVSRLLQSTLCVTFSRARIMKIAVCIMPSYGDEYCYYCKYSSSAPHLYDNYYILKPCFQ